jgi:hypothetical protein
MTTFVPTRDLTLPTAAIRHSRHLVPVGLVLAATSLSAIAFVQAVRPSAHDATTLVRDHSNGELLRVIGGGVLAGGWAQWTWSVLVGLAIFAVLQARLGRASVLGCVVATHFVPAVAVALAVPVLGHATFLAYLDAAISVAVVVAAAAMWSGLAPTAR